MNLASRMSRLGTETAFEVLARARALEAQGRDVVHLEIGEPDFDTPANIVEAGRQALSDGFTHYGPSPGLPALRERPTVGSAADATGPGLLTLAWLMGVPWSDAPAVASPSIAVASSDPPSADQQSASLSPPTGSAIWVAA